MGARLFSEFFPTTVTANGVYLDAEVLGHGKGVAADTAGAAKNDEATGSHLKQSLQMLNEAIVGFFGANSDAEAGVEARFVKEPN